MPNRPVLFALIVASITLVFGASAASASTLKVVDGRAVFTGAPGEANDVQMVPPFTLGTLTITDAGAPLTAGAGCTQIDAYSAFCAEDTAAPLPLDVATGDGNDNVNLLDFLFRKISVTGGRGDDKLYVSSHTGTPAHIDGGPGNDDLKVDLQLGAEPVLRGGTGDDTVSIVNALGGLAYGDAGNDRLVYRGFTQGFHFPLVLDGGAGNDTYAFEYQFVPTAMVAGSGLDTLDESTANAQALGSFTFDLLTCPGCADRVIGTAQADRITGDSKAQTIQGGDGDDVLDGGGGTDTISGEAGNDTITSRDGKPDVVTCGAGTDTVAADGRDTVSPDCESVTVA
jgi:Ca2+-binding RTX toxin-like protein